MSDICQKERWHNCCCCNCKNQIIILKHPWNHGDGKGRITERMGFGCQIPEMQEGQTSAVFFDAEHGMCEMHDLRN